MLDKPIVTVINPTYNTSKVQLIFKVTILQTLFIIILNKKVQHFTTLNFGHYFLNETTIQNLLTGLLNLELQKYKKAAISQPPLSKIV